MRRRTVGISILGLTLVLAGCRGEARPVAGEHPPSGSKPALVDEGQGPPSWGPRVPELVSRELLAAELGRRVTGALRDASAGVEGRDHDARALRERALWSIARIGGVDARDLVLAEFDGGQSVALAAAALLEVPRTEPGSPPQPLAGGPWGELEDALWTRLAVTDPSELGQARALSLAIARTGGARSVERFGVELAEVPGAEHTPESIARWLAGMRGLGLLCARGLSLDQPTAEAMSRGLEQRAGVDPSISLAAIYALSRCARSSGELLVESRELLVERLTPHVEDPPSADHAALAWRSLAGLGELPATIPAAILGPEPPPWTVEVEAVRALAAELGGAALVRERLAGLPITAFAGARQHVLLGALQAMRGVISAAPPTADAELAGLVGQLELVRRGEDSRLRKLAALALCEVRLLQAIRSGETDELVGCHELAGAPVVELPTALLVNLEVEALLRATRADAPSGALSSAPIDDAEVIADTVDATTVDPGRRARVARLLQLAGDRESARATPALAALAEIDDPSVLPSLRTALTSDDPGVLAAAATAVAVRSVDASKRDLDAVSLLEAIVEQRTEAGALEARLAAIEALGALARTAVASVDPNPTQTAPAANRDSPWLARTIVPLAADANVAVRRRAREALLGHEQLLVEFDREERGASASRDAPFSAQLLDAAVELRAEGIAGLRVSTSAGTFTIEFAGVAAPINQANLVTLARAGYYEGLSFHRVVPGFVVQGGDPRGDGYGGPGHVVPCEWSNLHYERGTVGIALAGKDTGGSQFFVTQTPQPHLDARYTVVGQVGEGLEVIDLLLPGDRIETVEIIYEGGQEAGR